MYVSTYIFYMYKLLKIFVSTQESHKMRKNSSKLFSFIKVTFYKLTKSINNFKFINNNKLF